MGAGPADWFQLDLVYDLVCTYGSLKTKLLDKLDRVRLIQCQPKIGSDIHKGISGPASACWTKYKLDCVNYLW